VFAFRSTLTYLFFVVFFSRNVPLLHTSRYVIVYDSVLPGCKWQMLGWEGLGTRL